MKKFILTLFTFHFALVGLLFTLGAQPSITWQRVYDGPSHNQDFAKDICASTDGNYYVVGATRYPFYYAIYVLKINDNGDTLWTRIIGGWTFGGQLANAVTPSSDGGCVLTGDADTAFTMKFSTNGDLVWYKQYGGRYIRCLDITKTLDGGYIACGYLNDPNINGYILKIDSLGNLQWQRKYYSADTKALYSILQVPSGGYLTVGTTSDFEQDTARSLIMKVDDSGNVDWERRLNLLKGSSAITLSRINSGYLIGGWAFDTTVILNTRMYFAKIDSNGNRFFTCVYPFVQYEDWFVDMKVINENKYIISALRDSSFFVDHAKVIIVDSTGNILHSKTNFSNGTFELFYSALALANGDIILTGLTDYFDYDDDLYIVRTDSALNTTTIGIEIQKGAIPRQVTLLQNYPNPFNSETIIRFNISENAVVQLTIYNINGQEIEVLLNQGLRPGSYKVTWNGTNFSSGIYFYLLKYKDKALAKKLVLLK